MAGLIATLNTAEQTLSTATTKTLIQLISPANHRVKILAWGISFSGVSGTAEPVVCELVQQSTAGTMSALTPVKQNVGDPETPLSTAQQNAGPAGEPGYVNSIARVEVHPQGGFQETFPFGQEVLLGGSSSVRVGLRATAPAGVDCIPFIRFEE